VLETSIPQGHYLRLEELMIEEIIWVDEVEGLLDATCYIEDVKVIGLDCEWKPNYVKGSKPNKVNENNLCNRLMLLHLRSPEP
jgi:hypothetical protein